MFDVASARALESMTFIPPMVLSFLVALALLCAVLGGQTLATDGRKGYFLRLIFAFCIASTVLVIVDLQNPRLGFIRTDYTDRPLKDMESELLEVTSKAPARTDTGNPSEEQRSL
jgi:hypothetical protein